MPEKMRFIERGASLRRGRCYRFPQRYGQRAAARPGDDMAKPKRSKPAGGAKQLIRRLQRLSTETVSDVLDVMGLANQVLSAAIRPLASGMRVAGPAFCVRGHAIDEAHPAPAGATFEVD